MVCCFHSSVYRKTTTLYIISHLSLWLSIWESHRMESTRKHWVSWTQTAPASSRLSVLWASIKFFDSNLKWQKSDHLTWGTVSDWLNLVKGRVEGELSILSQHCCRAGRAARGNEPRVCVFVRVRFCLCLCAMTGQARTGSPPRQTSASSHHHLQTE